MQTRLSELKKNEMATVVGFACEKSVIRRLLELGVTPNITLFCVRWSPMGGVIEVRVRGYLLAIGYADAQEILVEKEGKQYGEAGSDWKSKLWKKCAF